MNRDRLPFAKGQALGNDYLVIDAADLPWPLTPARVRALCDRHRGIGSDGILLAKLDGAVTELRIYNPDGTEAEKSGNGLRIFAAYLHRRGLVSQEPFDVRLARETVRMRIEAVNDDGALDILAEMGRASFRGADAGFAPAAGEALGHELELASDERVRVNPVSLGNPHCVVLRAVLERASFLRQAPQLAVHPAFPAGTNVQFARVAGPRSLEAWIYERGAGETLASGSSACAVAAVAVKLGLVAERDLDILMPGGRVRVQVGENYELKLRGPAQIVFTGELTSELASHFRELAD